MPISSLLPGAVSLAHIPTLFKEAKKRFAWFDYYRANTENVAKTCRHFGISLQCFYEWKKKYNPFHLKSLEEKSRRPKHTRTWEVSRLEEFRILGLCRAHIRYGKMKIRILYGQEYGTLISSWKIQRVIEKHRLYYHPKKTEWLRERRKRHEVKRRITQLAKEQRTGFLVALDTMHGTLHGRSQALHSHRHGHPFQNRLRQDVSEPPLKMCG